MSKKKNEADLFARVSFTLIDSDAYGSVSHLAIRVYMTILRRFNGWNNGHIDMDQRTAMKEVGCSSPKMMVKAFAELESRGILFRSWMGRRIGPTKGLASQWEVTDLPTYNASNQRVDPSRDYLKWEEGTDFRLPAETDPPNRKNKRNNPPPLDMGPKVLSNDPPLNIPTDGSSSVDYDSLLNSEKFHDTDDIPF